MDEKVEKSLKKRKDRSERQFFLIFKLEFYGKRRVEKVTGLRRKLIPLVFICLFALGSLGAESRGWFSFSTNAISYSHDEDMPERADGTNWGSLEKRDSDDIALFDFLTADGALYFGPSRRWGIGGGVATKHFWSYDYDDGIVLSLVTDLDGRAVLHRGRKLQIDLYAGLGFDWEWAGPRSDIFYIYYELDARTGIDVLAFLTRSLSFRTGIDLSFPFWGYEDSYWETNEVHYTAAETDWYDGSVRISVPVGLAWSF